MSEQVAKMASMRKDLRGRFSGLYGGLFESLSTERGTPGPEEVLAQSSIMGRHDDGEEGMERTYQFLGHHWYHEQLPPHQLTHT